MSLVDELQISAEKDDVLTVLRKTKRLASKLDRRDISDWLQAEHNGYASGQSVPDYRRIDSIIAYKTNGYVPAGFGRMKNGIEDIPFFGNFPTPLTDSVSSVLSMIESINEGNGVFLTLQEGTEISRKIRSHLNIDPMLSQQISFLMRFNSMQIKTIPERIKDKVLEWACDLEVAGVRGDGMSFSAKEKEIAHNTTFNIFNSIIDQLNNNGTNQKD